MTARPMALMATEDVSRQFGSVRAVDQISIELNADESVGLIGPNGAGKTTLLSLLSGALKPSSGRNALTRRPTSDCKMPSINFSLRMHVPALVTPSFWLCE